MLYSIPRLDSSLFDWLSWKNGSIIEVFNIYHREPCIRASGDILRKHAVGYCPSEFVPCRPKEGFVSVMFYTDREWWTHLKRSEFDFIFGVKT